LLAVRFNLFEIMATVKRRRGDDHLALYATDKRAANRPWRAGEAVMLASMDVVIGGVGYLL
jgi:copper transporter 1